MARVPTPASQGAQQLGGVQVNTGTQPFKSLNVPRMDGTANLMSQMAQGAAGVAELADAIEEKNYDAFLLETQRNITTYRQDQQAGWKAPAINEDGTPNVYSALGGAASKEWVQGREEDFSKMSDGIKSDKRYLGLSEARRFAIDQAIQIEQLAHRAQVMEHSQTQASLNLQAERNAMLTLKTDEAIGHINSPALAYSAAVSAMSVIDSEARDNHKTISDPVYQITARKQLDIIAQKAIKDILDSNDPDRVEKARDYLGMISEVALDGEVIKISAEMKQDLKTMINGSQQISKGRDIGNKLYEKHGNNKKDIMTELQKMNLAPEVEDHAKAQVDTWINADVSQQANLEQEAVQRSNINALNGQEVSYSDSLLLGPDKTRALNANANYFAKVNAGDATLIDDQGTLNSWYKMTTAERGAIPVEQFMTSYANSVRPETRQVMIAEWFAAREGVQAEENALTNALKQEAKDYIKSEHSSVGTYFEKQMSDIAAAYYPDTTEEGAAESKAMLEFVLRREFKERHTLHAPLSQEEADSLLNDLVSKITVGEKDRYVFEAAAYLKKDDGTIATGVDLTGYAIGAQIAPRDIPDIVRWYRRQNNLGPADAVPLSALNEFYIDNVRDISWENLSAQDRAYLDQTIADAGLIVDNQSRQDFYRSHLIQKGGR